MDDSRRAVPRTDVVLADPGIAAAVGRLGAARVKAAVHDAQERCRAGLLPPEQVVRHALELLPMTAGGLRAVVNATGVIVHTNLGRAALSKAAREAIDVAAGSTDLEMSLETGLRDRRGRSTLQALSAAVPAAGDVLVVNNGAAALSLVAHALAPHREIIVARGELVEIGDGFRIPELLTASGAVLREVGTTNRVRLADYADAITDATALILKVHPSNFVVRGFASSVDVGALATLTVPVVADIGSGLLNPHPRLPDEPDATTALLAGASLVTASGDKLLGGPQAGLILGAAPLVERLRRHPVARAFRVDKLTLAALEATLTGPPTPVALALQSDPSALLARAIAIAAALAPLPGVAAVPTRAVVGGGGAPEVALPSAGVAVPAELAVALRLGEPSVVGHLKEGRLLLDLIAVDPSYDDAIVEAVRRATKD